MESMEVYADCLRLMELALGHRHINVAAVLNNLAGLSVRLHMYTSAEGLYARALTIIRSHFGAQHPRCARPPPSAVQPPSRNRQSDARARRGVQHRPAP